MNEALKPCPFCGGEAQMITNHVSTRLYSLIVCKQCETATKRYGVDHEFFEISKEEAAEKAKREAITAWNKRVTEVLENDKRKIG
jgi:Lar family restriction alleviation protein